MPAIIDQTSYETQFARLTRMQDAVTDQMAQAIKHDIAVKVAERYPSVVRFDIGADGSVDILIENIVVPESKDDWDEDEVRNGIFGIVWERHDKEIDLIVNETVEVAVSVAFVPELPDPSRF